MLLESSFKGGGGDRGSEDKVRDFEPHSPKDFPIPWTVSFYDTVTEGRSSTVETSTL